MTYKTRLTKGCTNKVFHKLFRSRDAKAYIWAMNLKPGDIFNSYDAKNHEVKSIQILWRNVSQFCQYIKSEKMSKKTGKEYGRNRAGKFVTDVRILSTDGMAHHISETGCIVPAYPKEEIIKDMFGGEDMFHCYVELGILNSEGTQLKYPEPESEEVKILNKLSDKLSLIETTKTENFKPYWVGYPTISMKTRKGIYK